jgi:5'-nucleotidase
MSDSLILITNDDGVHAEGIRALTRGLAGVGRVVTVAPDREQSATSHALTLHRPLRVWELAEDVFAVQGTPTDCVLMAVRSLLDRRPDVVVSGINDGPNMGDDVNYSGTVAAAIEGSLLGVPSLAVSLGKEVERDFGAAAAIAARLTRTVLEREMPGPPADELPVVTGRGDDGEPIQRPAERVVLNVNVPGCRAGEIGPVRLTRLGKRFYRDAIVEKTDPRGERYYWIGGEAPTWLNELEDGIMTDFSAVERRHVSVTPLRLDWTDYDGIRRLADWQIED